jgi:hypothetical protein
VRGCIPPGALVLGFQHYWLGLRDHSYRTWLLPLMYADRRLFPDPRPLDAAIENIHPDVLLIDQILTQLLRDTGKDDNPFHYIATGFQAYRARHHLDPRCVIHDRTYGMMEVYVVTDQ